LKTYSTDSIISINPRVVKYRLLGGGYSKKAG